MPNAEVASPGAQMMQIVQTAEVRTLQAETQFAAAAASRPLDGQRTEIVDIRLLSKPKNFSGKHDEWAAWAFKIKTYLGAPDGVLLKAIDAAEADVLCARLTPEVQERNRKLYYVLMLLLDDQALKDVMPVPVLEGNRA